MKVCILQFNITGGVYEPLYSAVHPLKCIESDVMWYNHSIVENTELWKITVKVVLHSKMFNSAFRSSPYSSSKSSSPPLSPSPLQHHKPQHRLSCSIYCNAHSEFSHSVYMYFGIPSLGSSQQLAASSDGLLPKELLPLRLDIPSGVLRTVARDQILYIYKKDTHCSSYKTLLHTDSLYTSIAWEKYSLQRMNNIAAAKALY